MMKTLAFDVYGTLIDTSGVFNRLQPLVGAKAEDFTDLWRSKQLEYSFRRGLMQNYADFSVCTRQALEFCCRALQVEIVAEDKETLLQSYRSLPAFADAQAGLAKLQGTGLRLFAFSNGPAGDVSNLLQHAGIDRFFAGVVSCDEIKSFKPNPAVYAHFLRRADCAGSEAWMISSNPFDVIGARSAGMGAVWVRRSQQAVFDPWEIEPTLTIDSLVNLAAALTDNS